MEPPRIENNFSPSFLYPFSAFSAFSARDSLTPRWAEDVKSGLLLRRPLSSDSQLQRLLRGIFPGQQCAFARVTKSWRSAYSYKRVVLAELRFRISADNLLLFSAPPRRRANFLFEYSHPARCVAQRRTGGFPCRQPLTVNLQLLSEPPEH